MSALTVIRSFTIGYEMYRHVIDLTNDEVYLQHYHDDEGWQTKLRFDANANVFDAHGTPVGHFSIQGDNWVFTDGAVGVTATVVCCSTRGAESLLDSEVIISKRWIAQQVAA